MPEIKTSDNNFTYFTPSYGKVPPLNCFPESYKLYVCPSACGRRFGIRAVQSGEKNSVSFLVVTEADIVSGHYEDSVSAAIAELLVELAQKPKVFFIYFYCIDDLLGTDQKALVQRLYHQFPSCHFVIMHVDPIARDEKFKSKLKPNSQVYDLLEYTGKKDAGINLLGHMAPIDTESELFRVLSGWGIHTIRQRFSMRTFAEFMQMADSRLNLILSKGAKHIAQNMAEKLDIPCVISPVSYDIDNIVKSYQSMAEILGGISPDFSQDIEQTRQTIQKTHEHIRNTPIVIDSTAASLPFGLAKALCGYGFNVETVLFVRLNNTDKENREWLEKHFPRVSIVRSQDFRHVMDAGNTRECIAIGFDGAFILHANHFVNMRLDESLYGFHGIRKLMRLITEAYDTVADRDYVKKIGKEFKSR